MNAVEQEQAYRDAMRARRAGEECPLCGIGHGPLTPCPPHTRHGETLSPADGLPRNLPRVPAARADAPPISVAFAEFHRDNPHVYHRLLELAQQGKAAGARKLGISQLFEVLRWQTMLRTNDPDFKLNNNYRAHYARLIMERNPNLEGIFELRRSHADEASDA